MRNEKNDELDRTCTPGPSRREFVAASAAVGLVAAAGSDAATESQVVETDVSVTTPDGTCDAAFLYPASGSHAGVLIWTDIFGLRPTFRAFGRRLAARGYAVLVPNPFYRTQKAPVISEAEISGFSFADPATRAKIQTWTGPMNAPGALERDAQAHIAFLDAQPQVDRSRKIGTQGYCMGGPPVFRTCAQVPERVGAGATLHGGGLVTDKPDSPHLLAPKIKARMYIAIAASDDTRQPDAKDKLRAAFGTQANVEVYPGTIHGWCVPDMPQQNGKPIYNKLDAELAWTKLLVLYHRSLA
jgi:carboxymethylenebutenolidase